MNNKAANAFMLAAAMMLDAPEPQAKDHGHKEPKDKATKKRRAKNKVARYARRKQRSKS